MTTNKQTQNDPKTYSQEYLVKLHNYICDIITGVNHHSPTANHLYWLKKRLLNRQTLTPKMKSNLAWIEKDFKNGVVR